MYILIEHVTQPHNRMKTPGQYKMLILQELKIRPATHSFADDVVIKQMPYAPLSKTQRTMAFTVTAPDADQPAGSRPQQDALVNVLESRILRDEDRVEGLVMKRGQLLKPSIPPRQHPGTSSDKERRSFEPGKDMVITLSPDVMQSSAIQQGMSIGDILVNDLIDDAIAHYESLLDSYNKRADDLARKGIPIKAFYHPLMSVMRDPDVVKADKENLRLGLNVEGNRILIPAKLITHTLRPFMEQLLLPKDHYTVQFTEPSPEKNNLVIHKQTAQAAEGGEHWKFVAVGVSAAVIIGVCVYVARK